MSDDKKPKSDPVGHLKSAIDRRMAITTLEGMMPDLARMAVLTAQIRKMHYDAAIKEGFTSEQALELCKKTSL